MALRQQKIDLARAWRTAFSPPDRRPIPVWGAEHVELPPTLSRTGKFNPSVSPQFAGPFAALKSDSVREVSILKPVRGGGTLIADVAAPWAISCDNAGVLWAFHDEKIAKEHAELRQWPIIDNCPPLQSMLPINRHRQRTQEIIFNNGLPLIFCGPAISNFQSRGFKWVILDEPWAYKAGIMGQAIARLGDFVKMGNSKLLCISQGGETESDWDNHVKEQVMHDFAVPCLAPSCGRYFFPKWTAWRPDRTRWGVLFDAPRQPGGGYDVAKGIATLRFACEHCGHEHFDHERTRQAWRSRGRWVCEKLGAESPEVTDFPERTAFHWNALIDYPWAELLKQWLAAQRARHMGNYEPLVTFIQKRLAEMASEATVHDRDQMFATFEQSAESLTAPAAKLWPEEAIRFMSIDRQGEQTYWVQIRAWAKGTGESRRVYFGRAHSEHELEALRIRYGVAKNCTVIDSGFEARGDGGVYSACIRYGWIAVKGDEKKAFYHPQKMQDGSTQRVLKPWAPLTYGDPGVGTAEEGRKRCPLIIFSAPTMASRVQGLIEAGHWVEPKVADGAMDEMEREYAVQMTAEFQRPRTDKFTGRRVLVWVCPSRNNHAFDCAKMQVLAAMQAKLIPAGIELDALVPESKPTEGV
jgi:hypothetical protein